MSNLNSQETFSERFKQLAKLKEIVPLIPELKAGQVEYGDIPGIYTKFFHTVLVPPQFYDLANKAYIERRDKAEKAYRNRKWASYLQYHEKPYRLDAIIEIASKIDSDQEFMKLFVDTWTDVENVWQSKGEFIQTVVPVINELPDSLRYDPDVPLVEDEKGLVTLYRGYCAIKGDRHGLSYTTSLNKARWFSRRLSEQPEITTIKIPKKHILFTTNQRNESEAVTDLGEDYEIY